MKNIILSIVLGVMCMSCSSNKYVAANISGDWKIDNVLGIEVNTTEEEVPFISFQKEEARFSGNTGCNNFFGDFEVNENTDAITLSNVGSTKKLCFDMTIEDAIFSALGQVSSVSYDNSKMEFKDNNGKVIMELSPIK